MGPRLLEAIQSVIDEIPIVNVTRPVTIVQNTFAVSAQPVDDEVLERGQTFALNLFNFNQNASIGSGSLSFNESAMPPTASIQLPSSLFSILLSNHTNGSRITNSVFLTDALFQRRNVTRGSLEVASVVISASVVTVDSREIEVTIDPPITLTFALNPVRYCKIFGG